MTFAVGAVLFLLVLGLGFGYLCLTAAIGQWAWNDALVPLTHLPKVGYWQMVGIIFLVNIFTGGIFRLNLSGDKK